MISRDLKLIKLFLYLFIFLFSLSLVYSDTLVVSIQDNNDNAEERSDNSVFGTGVNPVTAGRSGGAGTPFWYSGYRFENITIPKGSTINSVYVEFTATATETNSPMISNIYFNDVNNANDFSTEADVTSRTLTTNFTSWSVPTSTTNNNKYNTSNIKGGLQEVVDRSGWSSGNAIVVLPRTISATAGEDFQTYYYNNDPAKTAKLYIDFTPAASIQIDNINLFNNTFTNDSSLYVALNLSTIATNSNINTTLFLSNGSSYEIGTNTQNVTFTLNNIEEGNYSLYTFSKNNETNVTSDTFFYTFDFTNPSLNVTSFYTSRSYNVNLSNLINFSDTNLDYCNVTFLNTSVYNCTDIITMSSNGNTSYNVTLVDLAGNRNKSNNNIIFVNPYQYFRFHDGSNFVTDYSFGNKSDLNGYVNYTIYGEGLNLGNNTLQFSKLGYIAENFSFTLNTTSSLNLTFNVTSAKILVNIYDRTTGNLLNQTVNLNILELANTSTSNGTALLQNFSFSIGNYTIEAISDNYYTESRKFYYSGIANSQIDFYLLDETLNTSSTLFVPVTDEFDNVLAGADTRLLEYDTSIFGFKEVSQCITDSNGECEFLIEVGLKRYIVTGSKVINGVLYTDQSSEEGEFLQREISSGTDVSGEIIRQLKLKITDNLVVPNYFGITISAPKNENETIVLQNVTNTVINLPISFTATDGLSYTVCLELYRYTNTTVNSVISPICTTGASGILPTSNITLNNDFNYQAWITVEIGNDKLTYDKYYYPSNKSFIEVLIANNYVHPAILFFWVILLGWFLYFKDTATWVYGSWSISLLQLGLFPSYLFTSACISIILINAGVLYLGKKQEDSR